MCVCVCVCVCLNTCSFYILCSDALNLIKPTFKTQSVHLYHHHKSLGVLINCIVLMCRSLVVQIAGSNPAHGR